jgi:hypothetical protein
MFKKRDEDEDEAG